MSHVPVVSILQAHRPGSAQPTDHPEGAGPDESPLRLPRLLRGRGGQHPPILCNVQVLPGTHRLLQPHRPGAKEDLDGLPDTWGWGRRGGRGRRGRGCPGMEIQDPHRTAVLRAGDHLWLPVLSQHQVVSLHVLPLESPRSPPTGQGPLGSPERCVRVEDCEGVACVPLRIHNVVTVPQEPCPGQSGEPQANRRPVPPQPADDLQRPTHHVVLPVHPRLPQRLAQHPLADRRLVQVLPLFPARRNVPQPYCVPHEWRGGRTRRAGGQGRGLSERNLVHLRPRHGRRTFAPHARHVVRPGYPDGLPVVLHQRGREVHALVPAHCRPRVSVLVPRVPLLPTVTRPCVVPHLVLERPRVRVQNNAAPPPDPSPPPRGPRILNMRLHDTHQVRGKLLYLRLEPLPHFAKDLRDHPEVVRCRPHPHQPQVHVGHQAVLQRHVGRVHQQLRVRHDVPRPPSHLVREPHKHIHHVPPAGVPLPLWPLQHVRRPPTPLRVNQHLVVHNARRAVS
eukprot:Sspe_Gene.48967::Locus_25935_Transcript_1_1_Confidence_1.000_Length_1904::g.48967::m.48967